MVTLQRTAPAENEMDARTNTGAHVAKADQAPANNTRRLAGNTTKNDADAKRDRDAGADLTPAGNALEA